MPNFDIESFKANFKGGAKSYLFYFLPRFPSINMEGLTDDKVTYLVRASSLPENTLEETIVNWQGFDFKLAAKNTYTDFTVTFNVDINANILKLYENWMNLIHDPVTNNFGAIDDYMVDQKIRLLDYNGNKLVDYKLYNAWPKTIAAVTLDYSSTDTAQFDLTFSYTHHTRE